MRTSKIKMSQKLQIIRPKMSRKLQIIRPNPIGLILPEPSFLCIVSDGNSIGRDDDSYSVTWMTDSQRLRYGARLEKDGKDNGQSKNAYYGGCYEMWKVCTKPAPPTPNCLTHMAWFHFRRRAGIDLYQLPFSVEKGEKIWVQLDDVVDVSKTKPIEENWVVATNIDDIDDLI